MTTASSRTTTGTSACVIDGRFLLVERDSMSCIETGWVISGRLHPSSTYELKTQEFFDRHA